MNDQPDFPGVSHKLYRVYGLPVRMTEPMRLPRTPQPQDR